MVYECIIRYEFVLCRLEVHIGVNNTHMPHEGIFLDERLLLYAETVSHVLPTLVVYGVLIFRQAVTSAQDRIARLASGEFTLYVTRKAFGCGRKLLRERKVFWGG